MNENTATNTDNDYPGYNRVTQEVTIEGRVFKCSTSYLHPKYGEVYFISGCWTGHGKLRSTCYVALHSLKRLVIEASEIGEESPIQRKKCGGCGVLVEPLQFRPNRGRCWMCVQRERQIRKTERENEKLKTISWIWNRYRLEAAYGKIPECREKIAAAETMEERVQIINEVLGRSAA